mmetsp:Transcript_18405/g.25483  ORF Transcript_18405/g.25483 Transcript_18405/m.25483 type:complete len:96 (+) Transcript_18405:405-692(+)
MIFEQILPNLINYKPGSNTFTEICKELSKERFEQLLMLLFKLDILAQRVVEAQNSHRWIHSPRATPKTKTFAIECAIESRERNLQKNPRIQNKFL